MSRIGRSGAAVVVLTASLVAHGAGAARAAAPAGLLAAICDELGPDTFVHADRPVDLGERRPVVAWMDVTRTDVGTGRYVSHERVLDSRSEDSVDEICSFDLGDGSGSVTLGLVFGDRSEP